MADTRIQNEVEDWVRREWMPREFGQRFSRDRVRLTSGGVFDFDAVSEDQTVLANVSTGAARTHSGKIGVGKMMKIRSDLYFLLLTNATRRLMIFTEQDMFEQWQREQSAGRVPDSIEFHLAAIPNDLRMRLEESRLRASKEVRPS